MWPLMEFKTNNMQKIRIKLKAYDHRLIDGADGARFIREIIAGFENFDEAILKGDHKS